MISNLGSTFPLFNNFGNSTQSAHAIGDQASRLVGGAVQAVYDAVELKSGKAEIALLLGPWLRAYGVGVDESTRRDDAPDFSGRLSGPEGSTGTLDNPGVLTDPASRPGTSIIGVEAGIARFLALDLEAVNKLGSAYLTGSIDFAKVRAEIFGGLIFEYPEIGFENWRLKVGNNDPGLSDEERREKNLFQIGLRVGVQVMVELIGAHYEAGYDSPPIPILGRELPVELTARLDAAVHAFARAYAEGAVGTRNAVQVGGKAFAGASTTLSGQAELASMVGAEGSLTGWAGAGAEFTFGLVADFEENEFGVSNSAGVAVGVGASYDYSVSVSPGAIFDSTELPGRLPQIWERLADRVEDAGRLAMEGEISPAEFGAEVVSASGQAAGGVTESIIDSLP